MERLRDIILSSPITFGFEFESALDLQYQDVKEDNSYDRKIIFKTGNLEATIEEFDKDTWAYPSCNLKDKDGVYIVKKFNKPCLYNLEIAMGVYRYDNLIEFKENDKNKKYYASITKDLSEYKDFLEEKNKRR